MSGTPAIMKVGLESILFGTEWMPTAASTQIRYSVGYPDFDRRYDAGYPAGCANRRADGSIPGRGGTQTLSCHCKACGRAVSRHPFRYLRTVRNRLPNPLMYKLERLIFRGSTTHQFTGGANLLSAVIVLAIMILPTVINISETSIRAVPAGIKSSFLGHWGASHVQTIFRSILPAAKSGIVTAIVLGVGRAIGEAMAITLVSGSSVNVPLPFNSVRFLTTAPVRW